ncbi:molybdopterin-dependent oxidoreductase [Rugamonas sp. CCM 8940]|uniref:molybdopterin-dependent oxidoreductase n=1 Tax=Rugamonas sp. CCM 8940 TaxID=2765359 RepID=UPI0018F4795D|nr:molybdopterin-dependent oxidoreductase [Rugamonas sp. CCM 8940]MBJ7313952.1 molybdopterin-dependent oxidoreductase [Rugamonas sp. CCM 8940]
MKLSLQRALKRSAQRAVEHPARRGLPGRAAAGVPATVAPLRAPAGRSGVAAAPGLAEPPEGAPQERRRFALPGKLPLISQTYRPANFETPVEYFRTAITSNRAFFVRNHLTGIARTKAADWSLSVGGEGAARAAHFTLAQLRRDFPLCEITAVCQCAGNRRSLFQPRVPGLQWGVGAMGNARWRGVRLRDVLAAAGLLPEALEVAFGGADHAVLEQTADYVKSLPLAVALDENTLLAFEMNGQPLPRWNGYPVRLVVAGWSATYWVKQLVAIRVLNRAEDGFWMNTAYRLPLGKFDTPRFASQVGRDDEPVTTLLVNSLITAPRSGQRCARGRPIKVAGIAWDGGAGIALVEVSADLGATWRAARLGPDLGRFSFRVFTLALRPGAPGSLVLMARAVNRAGAGQAEQLVFNPVGYHHNVIQRVYLEVL